MNTKQLPQIGSLDIELRDAPALGVGNWRQGNLSAGMLHATPHHEVAGRPGATPKAA
eukprot:NODE_1649_length_884_cov_62.483832_g1291_i0.p6 GENE.NODE_1649_length_884_cov_62.483832_g1291_i0~~NODE_1649_length_884_cov_62.483832_g1291_i0.p6  ORF type:complete len:57 (+),score=5.71 NODE_1649_length_884_cov_62.483832_g1291_i0:162-332(+)